MYIMQLYITYIIHFTEHKKLTQHCKSTMKSESVHCSVMSDSLQPNGL